MHGWKSGSKLLATGSLAGVSGQSKENKTQGTFGIGASYAVTPAVEGLLEWKWVGSGQVSTAGVGLRVRF